MSGSIRRGEAGWFRDLKAAFRSRDVAWAGIADSDVMLHNVMVLTAKRRSAARNEFFVEAIADTAQVLEFTLTMWLTGKGFVKTVPVGDRTTLGGWIKRAEDAGLHPELVRRLKRFNRSRTQAIHRLTRGEILYRQLGEVMGRIPSWCSNSPPG